MRNGLIKLGFTPDADFILQDDSDGNGAYISSWTSSDAQPSAPAIATAEAEWQAEYTSQAYSRARANEYPDYKIYLDAIVKGDETQKQKYIDDCNAVKLKYPKG